MENYKVKLIVLDEDGNQKATATLTSKDIKNLKDDIGISAIDVSLNGLLRKIEKKQ